MVLGFLHKILAQEVNVQEKPQVQCLKIVIPAFEDECLINSGRQLAEAFAQMPMLNVVFNQDLQDKTFLNLQSRNFFDFIDTGKAILKKHKADVVVWGYREGNKIRLNFQANFQYEQYREPSFSLLNSLFLPLEYFQQQFPPSVLKLIYAAIVAVADKSAMPDKDALLFQIMMEISRESLPSGLDINCRPYILNILAIAYLHALAENLQEKDFKLILELLEAALKCQHQKADMLLLGNIYANLGQLYTVASAQSSKKKYSYCRLALQNFQIAQKYFNRYAFPYDFGLNAYRLSKLYFAYWKQVSDVQALRDAVFHLREAERIFAVTAFPQLWARIQGDLGFYLSMLGLFSRSDEISMLAVASYKNRQKIYDREYKPMDWARTEENIGNVFYNCGKQLQDEAYLEESKKYYYSAAEIYENYKLSQNQRQMQKCIAKADEFITALQQS